ncbi:hypothetical protein [Luteolibacter sp. AS25]|uniref:hypothetical protein n=1 Tax=Luteolibacter sp. AS25 TaxID=3135776 RepID=UPI00398ADC5E
MKFNRAEPNAQYRTLRLVSEESRWELGMSPYTHGIRMRMGPFGKPPSVLDFCMGENGSLYPDILLAILKKLEPVPEDQSLQAIDAVFPWKGTRADLSLHLRSLLSENQNHSFGSTP